MKTLLLLRHAKSSWANEQLSDFDRPLNSRGLETAPLVGGNLYHSNLIVNAILSSPAKRAKQTAVLVKETAQLAAKIVYDERIYEASPQTLLYLLGEQSDEKNETVLLVGHNPGLESLVEVLTGKQAAMKTAAIAKIDLNIDEWRDIAVGCGTLDYVFRPEKELETLTED